LFENKETIDKTGSGVARASCDSSSRDVTWLVLQLEIYSGSYIAGTAVKTEEF